MKKLIRLTEGDLHRIVENSIKQFIKEDGVSQQRVGRQLSGFINHKTDDAFDAYGDYMDEYYKIDDLRKELLKIADNPRLSKDIVDAIYKVTDFLKNGNIKDSIMNKFQNNDSRYSKYNNFTGTNDYEQIVNPLTGKLETFNFQKARKTLLTIYKMLQQGKKIEGLAIDSHGELTNGNVGYDLDYIKKDRNPIYTLGSLCEYFDDPDSYSSDEI